MRTHKVASALAIGTIVVPFTSAMSAPDAATRAGGCAPQWHLVPAPRPTGPRPAGANFVEADSVNAVSERDVRFAGNAHFVAPWSMRWNGRAVTETPAAPLGPMRQVTENGLVSGGLSYASADEGWLLLTIDNTTTSFFFTGGVPTAAHWQDGRWTLTPTAVLSNAEPNRQVQLSSVASLAADDAWAVGRQDLLGGDLSTATAVVEHWDGTQWKVVDHPAAAHPRSLLRDIDASSPTDVWAVGRSSGEAGEFDDAQPLVLHYDGTDWTSIPTPEIPVDMRPAEASRVSVTEDGQVWVVGTHRFSSSTDRSPLVMHYDGSGWQEVPAPPVNDNFTSWGDVYAAAGDDVWAVANNNVPQQLPPDLLHWDGTSWTTVEWPGAKELGLIYVVRDLDGTGPDDVWAVGSTVGRQSAGSNVAVADPQIAHLGC
jgi:hypothetical protein